MRQLLMARRAGVTLVAAVAGALFGAGPALADVTVSPASAVQGSGQNLSFHVTNTGAQPISTVTLKLPDDTPIAEVYPLSVDDWAPKIDMRTLSTALPTAHGAPATETAAAITWIAMPGKALAPGQSTDLGVAVGPLPDLGSMQFRVATADAAGKPGPAVPPVSLTLTPGAPGQALPTHSGHGGAATTTTGTGTDDPQDAAFAAIVAQAQRGPSFFSVAGWVVAGLALLGGLALLLRGRHRAEEDDEPDDDEVDAIASGKAGTPDAEDEDEDPADAEPVAAGRWSYRG
ncbi:DUF1775 domain-containing protein [Micromonosporaceae bacterium Da 78-11]